MQPEAQALLFDIRKAGRLIQSFAEGRTFEDYTTDPLLRSAVERQFEIIGEALRKLSAVDAPTVSQIDEYRKIVAFRNVLIHGYAAIQDDLVWGIVETKLPPLLTTVERLLSAE